MNSKPGRPPDSLRTSWGKAPTRYLLGASQEIHVIILANDFQARGENLWWIPSSCISDALSSMTFVVGSIQSAYVESGVGVPNSSHLPIPPPHPPAHPARTAHLTHATCPARLASPGFLWKSIRPPARVLQSRVSEDSALHGVPASVRKDCRGVTSSGPALHNGGNSNLCGVSRFRFLN